MSKFAKHFAMNTEKEIERIKAILKEIMPHERTHELDDIREISKPGRDGFTFGQSGLVLDKEQALAFFERIGVPLKKIEEIKTKMQDTLEFDLCEVDPSINYCSYHKCGIQAPCGTCPHCT